MDFDLSKENIQPLRGGRNVQQLGMALQAENNLELQMQLKQQQEAFEKAITTYTGDDPLENWFHYISWVEQSYPKHGHEGNLASLLENCLRLFEHEKSYENDRRFCKLWIKYIDLQPNPLEIYLMMKAKGLCNGCADFYKAWAYYYEAVGDFQAANNVFEEGRRHLAQPYEELEIAHQNLILAAGQHTIFGPDQNRLMEKRQALTSLHTYKSGRVPSVRVPSHNGLVTFPVSEGAHSSQRPNSMVFVYENRGMGNPANPSGPASIIEAARQHETVKENQMKPGPWTTMPMTKKRSATSHTSPAFTILDEMDVPEGIRLPFNHPIVCLEDYSDWHVSVKYAEPPNPSAIPMYPKERVYIDPLTEYSIEELRSARYLKKAHRNHLTKMDQELVEDVEYMQESLDELKNGIYQKAISNQMLPETVNKGVKPETDISKYEYVAEVNTSECSKNSPPYSSPSSSYSTKKQSLNQSNIQRQLKNNPQQEMLSLIWNDGSNSPIKTDPVTAQPVQFAVYEQTLALDDIQTHIPPKGNAMKTTALKDLTVDELVETGSCGGMDLAVTAQAADCASQNRELDMDDPYNTYQFNFHLKEMQVSTPQPEKPVVTVYNEEDMASTRKQLFTEPKVEKDKALSIIFEETKSGSSASSGATTKSSLFGNATNKIATISEEHNSYLQQNLSVNAELRKSLLGELMNMSSTSPPVIKDNSTVHYSQMQCSPLESPVRHTPKPCVSRPLTYAPSDPFKPSLINELLDRISFPGPHTYGYTEIGLVPRLVVKKEPVYIGNNRYIIDKQLGKGTFGIVFKAVDVTSSMVVAVKYQKPPNKWEFYICRELQSRLANHPLRERFMDVSIGYFSDQASILVSEFMPGGSLLDLANMHKQKLGKTMKECLVIYFCIEMLKTIQAMHEVKVIHADIKPDNFLVFVTPENTVGLQLIDFGCSIDMSLFPPNTSFTRRVTTEDFVCCEMLDGRPWNYHTDLFCVAATAHVLLFDSYIKMKKQDGMWSITQRFNRYMKVDLWNMFFSSLLNQETGPADSASLQFLLQEKLDILNRDSINALAPQMRSVVNLLKNR